MVNTAAVDPETAFHPLELVAGGRRTVALAVVWPCWSRLSHGGPLSTIQLARINAFVPLMPRDVRERFDHRGLLSPNSPPSCARPLVIASDLSSLRSSSSRGCTFSGRVCAQRPPWAGPQSTNWLYCLACRFPMFVIAYALLKDADPAKQFGRAPRVRAFFSSVAMTAAIGVSDISLTAYVPLLPRLMLDTTRVPPSGICGGP